jgi:Rrf2 family protein
LRRRRLLRSAKGIHGGYELSRPAETITLWEVFRTLEPDPYLDDCILGHGPCNPQAACALHADWSGVRRELTRLLQDKTIAEMADSIRTCQFKCHYCEPRPAHVEENL